MTMTTYEADRLAERILRDKIASIASMAVLDEDARRRFGRVPITVVPRGKKKGVPAKGWTDTKTGEIFIREEVFEGTGRWQMLTMTLYSGVTVHPSVLRVDRAAAAAAGVSIYEYQKREVQANLAAYGVLMHEIGHKACSEHARRSTWHMTLEDLRIEAASMDADPIRARQGLRACATHWVAGDSSPMQGEPTLDMEELGTKAALLHLYLLIVGRARIGVLEDESVLVKGVRTVADKVFGWVFLTEVDAIIDQYLETGMGVGTPEDAAERRRLAKAVAKMVKGEPPEPKGCGKSPKRKPKPKPQEDDVNDDEAGADEAGQEGGQEGEDSQEASQGQEGAQEGQEEGTGSQAGQDEGDEKEGSQGQGQGDDEGDSDTDDLDDDSLWDDDWDGEEDDEGDEGAGQGSQDGQDGEEDASQQGEGGTFGQYIEGQISDGDAGDDSDEKAERLTPQQVKELHRALTKGLKEVSDPNSPNGWGITDADAQAFAVKRSDPTKIARDVFSVKAKATRNARLRG